MKSSDSRVAFRSVSRAQPFPQNRRHATTGLCGRPAALSAPSPSVLVEPLRRPLSALGEGSRRGVAWA